ncbi:MAG: octanoyltransferase, partial [Bacillus sp. (in: firmicutes)]
SERVKERMRKAFKDKAVAINAISPRRISLEEAKEAFYKGFAEGLNIDLEPYQLTEEELAYVENIAKERYESDEWNFKR